LVSLSAPNHSVAHPLRNEFRERGFLKILTQNVKTHLSELHNDQSLNQKRGKKVKQSSQIEVLSSLEKNLKIIENVTYLSSENQLGFIDEPGFLISLLELLDLYERHHRDQSLFDNEEDATNFLYGVFRVLVNLTNGQVKAEKIIGEFEGGLQLILKTVLTVSKKVKESLKFDWFLLGLALLINLVEKDESNREKIRLIELDSKSALLSIIHMYNDLVSARSQPIEITQKSTQDNVVAAYAALLIGCLCRDNVENQKLISKNIEQEGFRGLVDMLDAFLSFNDAAGMRSSHTRESFVEVMNYLSTLI